MTKPAPPIVLGSGPMADEVRRMVAENPDRYRPRSSSTDPVGHCPCCGLDVYEVRTPLTNFEPGFATGMEDDAILHPRCNAEGFEDREGTFAGGCIPDVRRSEWKEQPKPAKKKRARRKP